jgi:hypothetical protein
MGLQAAPYPSAQARFSCNGAEPQDGREHIGSTRVRR